jgi:competence protein ComEC
MLFYILFSTMVVAIAKLKNVFVKTILILLTTMNIFYLSSLDDNELLPANHLSIMMIDVGQGDSFLIKFPNGKIALIDAGNTTFSFDNGERVVLPLLKHLGVGKVDYGFVSHLDADHYAGFVSLVMNKTIKEIYKPGLDSSLSKDLKFEKFLHESGVPIHHYKQEELNFGNSRMYFLYPKGFDNYNSSIAGSTNNKSGVIKLVYGNTSFLFTGDIEKPAEFIYANTFRNFLDSDVLKVAHHGSNTSSTNNFLNYVTPAISLISVGIQNNFGHPSDEILSRLETSGSKICRTDKEKAVLLRSDGKSVQIINWE